MFHYSKKVHTDVEEFTEEEEEEEEEEEKKKEKETVGPVNVECVKG